MVCSQWKNQQGNFMITQQDLVDIVFCFFSFLFIFWGSLESAEDEYLSQIFACIRLWIPHALVSSSVGSGAFEMKIHNL